MLGAVRAGMKEEEVRAARLRCQTLCRNYVRVLPSGRCRADKHEGVLYVLVSVAA